MEGNSNIQIAPGPIYFSLHFCLVLVVKRGRDVIDEKVAERMEEVIAETGKVHGISLEKLEYGSDYVKVYFTSAPHCHLQRWINSVKLMTNQMVIDEFPDIWEKLWQDFLWDKSFYLVSLGDADEESIKDYIGGHGKRNWYKR